MIYNYRQLKDGNYKITFEMSEANFKVFKFLMDKVFGGDLAYTIDAIISNGIDKLSKELNEANTTEYNKIISNILAKIGVNHVSDSDLKINTYLLAQNIRNARENLNINDNKQ